MAQLPYPPAPPAPAARGRTWPAVVLALGIALLPAVGWTLLFLATSASVSQLVRGTCLPSDFPQYAGQTRTWISANQTTSGPLCDMTFQSASSPDSVSAYYATALDEGSWEILSQDPSTGVIRFDRRGHPRTRGTLQVSGQGTGSVIQVQVLS